MASLRRPTVMTVGLLALFVAVLVALQARTVGAHETGHAGIASAVVHSPDGTRLGTVRMVQRGDQVLVAAKVRGLTPGFHGFHVHQRGLCDPPDFTSAGGHYNPTGAGHGEHDADFPSLLVNEDGTAELVFSTDRFTVAELRDTDGSAVMVHAGRDNFANIPERYRSTTEDVFGPDSVTLETGDSGARVGCGVVQ